MVCADKFSIIPMKKYLVATCAFNEGEKIKRVIKKCTDHALYDILVVDDGSTDGSLNDRMDGAPVTIIRHAQQMGAGYCVREMMDYAKAKGYVAIWFISGNDKDDPQDLYKIKQAIEEGYDFVQGSRYLPGGGHGRMPAYRKVSTRLIHPLLFSLITGKKITDSTNGFRGIRLSLLDDKRIDLRQDWLDKYELEPYLFFKAIRLGYKVKEVPVTKIYPVRAEGYTKMKPFSGWWSILRPLVYLGLGIKK